MTAVVGRARAIRQGLLRRWRRRATARRHRARAVVAPTDSPVAVVVGPSWLTGLVAPSVRLAGGPPVDLVVTTVGVEDVDGAGADRTSLLVVDPGLEPLVQHRCCNPQVRKIPPGLPPALRVAADRACRRAPRTPRVSASAERWTAWDAATRDAHLAYRRAMSATVDDAVRITVGRSTRPPLVTVLCVSQRPQELVRVIANFECQTWPERELLLVVHGEEFDLDEVRRRLDRIERARVVAGETERSLGCCLNLGMSMSSAPFVAKWDDDDVYGPHYLADAMLAHRWAEAGVVGKHSTYVALEPEGMLRLRFPGREFEYTSFVAGGTFVIDRSATAGLEFPDLTLGEDGEYLQRCEQAGVPVYAADRFNYVQRRTGENTWGIGPEHFARRSVVMATGGDVSSAIL